MNPAPPRDLIWEKILVGKILNFGDPPLRKRNKLRNLKLPKNRFKTNLFFLQLKYLKCVFTFGKTKIWPHPSPLIKNYETYNNEQKEQVFARNS